MPRNFSSAEDDESKGGSHRGARDADDVGPDLGLSSRESRLARQGADVLNQLVIEDIEHSARLETGDRVEARFSDGVYYHGQVSRARRGAFDIEFDDGDKETGLPRALVRSTLKPRAEIEARRTENAGYEAAEVVGRGRGGGYEVTFTSDGSTADVERSAIRFRFDAGDKVHAYDPDDVQRGPVPAVVRSVKTSRSRGHTYSVKFKGDSQSRRLQPWMVVASLPRRTLDDLRSQKWATGRFNKRELLEWLDAKGVATDDGSRIKRLLDAATDFSSRDRGSRLQYLTPLLATLGVHNPNASADDDDEGDDGIPSLDDDGDSKGVEGPRTPKRGRDKRLGRKGSGATPLDYSDDSDDDESKAQKKRDAFRRKKGSSLGQSFRRTRKDDAVNFSAQELRAKLREWAESYDGDLLSIFQALDRDGNGTISKRNLKKVIRRELKLKDLNEDELALLVDCFDSDKSGHIDYSAFRRFVLQPPGTDELGVLADKLRRALRDMLGLKEGDPRPSRLMDLRKVFDQFDDDESKTVDRDEFGENLRRLGVDIPREDMKLLLDRLDTDGDRQISFAEFIEFVEPERESKKVLERLGRSVDMMRDRGLDLEAQIQERLDKRGRGVARTEELRDFLLANLPFSNEEVRVLTLPFEAERGRTDYRKMIAASQRDASLPGAGGGSGDDLALDRDIPTDAPEKVVRKKARKKAKRLKHVDLAAKALREAIWDVIARHQDDDGMSTKQALATVFRDLDRRGTGYLGLKDLRAALQGMLAVEHIHEDDVKVLLECFDSNNDGRVDFAEFESFIRWQPEDGEELGVLAVKLRMQFLLYISREKRKDSPSARDLFQRFSHNGRHLTAKDLKKAFAKLQFEVSSREFKALFQRFDPNGDRRIDLSEFSEFIDPEADLRDLRSRFEPAVRRFGREGVSLSSLFADEDPRGKGVVTQAGFQAVVMRRMRVPLNEAEFRRILFRFDSRSSRDGVLVNYKEFLEFLETGNEDALAPELEEGDATKDDFFHDAMANSNTHRAVLNALRKSGRFVVPYELIVRVFEMLDTTRTGVVSVGRLPKLLLGLGYELDANEIDAVTKSLGSDSLTLEAFENIVRDLEIASIGRGMTAHTETAIRMALRPYIIDSGYTVSGEGLVEALTTLGCDIGRDEAVAIKNVVAQADDGSVSIPHFISFLKLFAAGGTPHLVRQRFSDMAHAFRKLTFGPLPSFDTFAKVYAALPDNFRPSALCAIRQHPAHQMSAVLSPTVWSSEHDVEQTRRWAEEMEEHRAGAGSAGAGANVRAGLVKPDVETITAWDKVDAGGGIAGAGMGLRYADLLPDVPTRRNKSFWGGHTLQLIRPIAPADFSGRGYGSGARSPAGLAVMQTVLEIRQAQGIPHPSSVPLDTVIGHRCRVSLMEELPPGAGGKIRYRCLGNQSVISAAWDVAEPDLWRFGPSNTGEPADNKLLLRTWYNTTLLTRMKIFVEFNLLQLESPHKVNEVVCAWTYLAFTECMEKRKTTLDLTGGSIHAPMRIHAAPVKRQGMRAVSHACTSTVAPSMTITTSNPYKLPKRQRHCVGYMPTRIVVPTFALPTIRQYRECVGDQLLMQPTVQNEDWDWSLCESDPFVGVFCQVAGSAMMLHHLGETVRLARVTKEQRRNPRYMNSIFRNAVRRMWPALCSSTNFHPSSTHKLQTVDPGYVRYLLESPQEPTAAFAESDKLANQTGLTLYEPFDVMEAAWPAASVPRVF